MFLPAIFFVGLRIVSRSFTQVNSLFPHLSALNLTVHILRSFLPGDFFVGLRLNCGRRWIRTTEGINQQIYSLPHLATLVFSRFLFLFRDDFVILRVVGQSFTQVNSFPPHSTSLSSQKINFKIPFVKELFSEPMEGIEPTTPRLQITCSGQLSYIGISFLGRMFFRKGLQR